MKLLIKNGRVINLRNNIDKVTDVLVNDGIIEQIGDDITCDDAKIIDASGLCVASGLVDLFARASEPEADNTESLLSLSHAAVKGGYTTLCVHTNASSSEQIRYICQRAEYASCAIIPAAKVADEKGKELLPHGALKDAGAGALYNEAPIKSPLLMRDALFRSRKYNMPMLVRCKESELYGEGIARSGVMPDLMDIPTLPASAESIMVARDIVLSKESGSPVHIGHVSTAASVDLIRMAKANGVKVTCSTEPHYIALSSRELGGYNTYAKLDPPLGNPSDLAALAAGAADGTIDCIASGHTPVSDADKRRSLVTAPYGASSVELCFAATLTTLYHGCKMPLGKVLDMMSGAPAAVLGINAGRIAEGEVADLIVFDPEHTFTASYKHLISAGKNTPFDKKELKGIVLYTVKDGRIVWQTEK